jgi:hypothetical protein
MEDMPRKLPLHVVRETTRHGTVKFYFRRFKGARIRLPNDLQSEEFRLAYEAACAGRKLSVAEVARTPHTSLRWLIDRYKESAAWRKYSDATRKQQDNFFAGMLKISGNAAFADIDKKAVELAMEDRSDRPALANNFYKALRGLFAWAVRNDHIEVDPTAGVETFKYKTEGFLPWTIEDYEKFCAKWKIGTKPRLALELLLHSGLRRSDIVNAGRQHLKGNIFTMKTIKTGATITAEFPDELIEIIGKTETGDLAFVVSELGTPFKKESFGNWFRDMQTLKAFTRSSLIPLAGVSIKPCRSYNSAYPVTDAQQLAMVQAVGAKIVRFDLPWADIEQKAGVYTWGAYASRFKMFAAAGIKCVLILGQGNPLYTQAWDMPPTTVAAIAAFARFAVAAYSQFGASWAVYEIYNEPNMPSNWGGSANPAQYGVLLSAVSIAMRAARSDVVIVSGGLAVTDPNAFIAAAPMACPGGQIAQGRQERI